MAETDTQRIEILLAAKTEAADRAMRKSAREIIALEKKYDPLARATVRLKEEEQRLSAALAAGTIDRKRYNTLLDASQKAYQRTEHAINSASTALSRQTKMQTGAGSMVRHNRMVFQQLGYQVGDFAVQVQGGTSAITAFTQQGSQMLGVFGPWGAIMGAVLAVGAPLAAVVWQLGDATEETKKKAKTFADRVQEANAALNEMSASASAASVGGLEELRRKYGELTQEVKDMAIEMFQADKRAALGKVSAIITEVTGEIAKAAEATAGTVSAALAASQTEAGRAAAEAYRVEIEQMQASIDARKGAGQFVDPGELETLREMREELAAMEGDFTNIGVLAQEISVAPDLLAQIAAAQEGLEAARDAGDFSAMADQLGLIRDLLMQAGEAVNQGVLDGVTQAESVAREMAARLQEGQDAADGLSRVNIAGNISAATTEAQQLANWLGISLARALALAATTPMMADEDAAMAQQVIPDAAMRESHRRAVDNYARLTAPKKVPKRGGGGGRGRKGRKGGRDKESLFSIAEEELQSLQRQIEMLGKTKGEVAALTVKYKLLDEAKKRGLKITDELTAKIDAEAANVGRLADEYDAARDKMAAMEKIQGEFKDSIIDAAMGGKNAMEQFTKSIKRAALEYLLFGEGMFAGGRKKSGGGILGGLFGSIFGGGGISKLLSFDGGGHTPSGARSGGIDGKGGFMAMLHPDETVIDRTKPSARPSSSGSDRQNVSVQVGVAVDDEGALRAYVQNATATSSRGAAIAAVQQVKGSLKAWNDQLDTDGALS